MDGRFRVQSELGCGGFGKTYEAIGTDQSSSLVLKVLINPMDKALELFKREAEVLGRLNHPGIPHVDADGYFVYFPRNAEEPLHCLMMEKIEGLNLQEYMAQRGDRPVNQKVVLKWFIEIVEILDIVHSQNFFHRDIKPSNVMLRTDGRVALIDFGTAREVTGTYMAKQEARGVTGIISAGYTPVEQLNGQAVVQSDFYALGRTITYLLTAKEPSDVYDAVTDEFPWQPFAPNTHSSLVEFLDQMMQRVPKFRPANTHSILETLNHLNQLICTQDPIHPSRLPLSLDAQANSAKAQPSSPYVAVNPSAASPPPPEIGAVSQPLGLVSQPLVSAPVPLSGTEAPIAHLVTANFVLRAIAFSFDLCLLGITTFVIAVGIGFLTQENFESTAEASGNALAYLILFVHPFMTWLYFSILHCSKSQSTLGKRILGLKVVTSQAKRLSFGKATVRFMCKLLSTLILVGYFVPLFSKRNQALHDIMAETLVIVTS